MPRYLTAVGAVLTSLPEDLQADAFRKVLPSFSSDKLLEFAEHDETPQGILAVLAEHPKAQVRQAVAANMTTSQDVLEILAEDKLKTVRTAAQRCLMWKSLAVEGAQAPACTAEAVKQIKHVARKHLWGYPQGQEVVVRTLFQDSQWRQNREFVRWCYEYAGLLDQNVLDSLDRGIVLRALLQALPKHEIDYAIAYLADSLSGQELLDVLQVNEDLLVPLVESTVGSGWQTAPLDAYDDHRPDGWARVGLSGCSDEVLLEALDCGEEYIVDLAAAHVRRRPHLHAEVIALITRRHEEGDYSYWEVAQALPDSSLLDVPLAMLLEEYGPSDQSKTRARTLFAHEAHVTLQANPQAWQTLSVLGEDYTGTAREMLAALANL